MEKKERSVFSSIVKGILLFCILSLISVIVFSFVLGAVELSDNGIKIINQAIKSICLTISCFCFVKKSKGFLIGGIIGLFGFFIFYSLLSLICGNFTFDMRLIVDCIFGMIIGVIAGIISVNLKKE